MTEKTHTAINMTTLTMIVIVMMMMAAGRVESITKFERRREAKNDLLSTHCIERSACMRQGGNMMGWVSYSNTANITCTCIIILYPCLSCFRSLVTEFPFHPPGIQSNRQE